MIKAPDWQFWPTITLIYTADKICKTIGIAHAELLDQNLFFLIN